MKKTKLKSASDFWLQLDRYDNGDNSYNSKSADVIQLASYQRAISNFVRIVTNKSIPVSFTTSKNSYTNGKEVVISSNVDDENFDPTVGLALHEASHIKLTDFKASEIRNIAELCTENKLTVDILEKTYKCFIDPTHTGKILAEDWNFRKVYDIIFQLTNYVEDRRIDNFIYTTAPGYRAYYHSLYDTYFNSKVIDKALRSKSKRTEDWDSYWFRIINLTNKNRDLSALKGLNAIWNTIDLVNISRLQSTTDSIRVAIDIFNIVEGYLAIEEPEQENEDEDSTPDSNDPNDNSNDSGEDSNDPAADSTPSQPNKSKGGKKSQSDELSDKEQKSLDKAIKDQEKFLSGKTNKKRVSSSDNAKIDSISASDVEVKDVVTPMGTVSCMVVKKLNQQLIDAEVFRCLNKFKHRVEKSHQYILDGVRLGTMLGKKLKIRSEARDTIFNRQKHGNIDKRMLSALGSGYENIFTRTETMSYNPGLVHISLDISSSMNGSKFNKAMVSIVAIAKACSMIDNMDCVISFRGTHDNPSATPMIMIGYDSRVDAFAKITSLFKYIQPQGYTPEGICFQAVMNSILESAAGKDAYFINFSDGEPCFSSYSRSVYSFEYGGDRAAEHTAKQIKKMTGAGIKVLSYFIADNLVSDNAIRLFKKMYGSDAATINVNNLNELAKTLNANFLKQ
jgi:hypothetical protein